MATPAIYLGDFAAERTRPIGSIPPEEDGGEFLRMLWITADPLAGDPSNYWLLTIGRYAQGAFKAERALPFPDGFSGGIISVALTPPIRFSRTDVLGLNVKPTGSNTSPLTGLSIIPDYALSGARAR